VTTRPAIDASKIHPFHLAVAQAGPARLERHPNDGWRLADPYPLGARTRRVLRAVVGAICPPSPAPRSRALLSRVEVGSRRMLRYAHPFVARCLALGLLFLDWLPILTLSSTGRLQSLESARASALLARWAHSRILLLRLLIQGARGLILSVYFDQSEVHDALHYDPVGFMRERIALRRHLLTAAPAPVG
jgi:hypothetical protein